MRNSPASTTGAAALAATVLMLWGVGAHATASNKELEARANDLDARLMAVERANETLVELQQQIETARQDIRALRGQIEEARHELEGVRKQQRDLYSDLDRRLLMIENNGVAASGAGRPAGSVQPGVQPGIQPGTQVGGAPAGVPTSQEEILAADETTVYGDAFAALKAGRYPEAISGFQLYLTKYPQGPRADSATYWLGEAQYVQRDYASAIKSFYKVVTTYPNSRKSADALLKVGFCQYELKSYRNARATLQKVATTYPGTDTGRSAEERLAKMDVEGR
jgi:tol-pal system protein YbgF